jgi:hypothetical protein
MAVIISNGNTSLSTVNGFYRVEAHNLPSSTTPGTYIQSAELVLKVLTFANAGNSLGCVWTFRTQSSAILNNPSTLTTRLQETRTPVTISIASPGVVTYTAHGINNGDTVKIETTGALPTGLNTTTHYYVVNRTADTFQLSLTLGGAAINTSGTQSGVHTVWIDRATVTKNLSEITGTYPSGGASAQIYSRCEDWVAAWEWAGVPVDTTAGKWRLTILATGSMVGASYTCVSATGLNCYAVWCDTAVSFNDNDAIICKDIVTIDKTATVKGVTGDSLATRAVAILVCSSLYSATGANAKLKWHDTPAASYTLTVDGNICLAGHAAFRIGTAAVPIPFAQQAILDFRTATVASNSLITNPTNHTSNTYEKSSLYWYGASQTGTSKTTLNGNVANGASSFTTTDSTGWVNGDVISVGRPARGGSSRQPYTVTSTSGTTVNITPVITGARTSGGQVIRLESVAEGHGIKIYGPTGSSTVFLNYTNLQITGLDWVNTTGQTFLSNGRSNYAYINTYAGVAEDPTYFTDSYIKNSSFWVNHATAGGGAFFFGETWIPQTAITIDNCFFHNGLIAGNPTWAISQYFTSGRLTISNCVKIHDNNGSVGFFPSFASLSAQAKLSIQSNFFEGAQHAFLGLSGIGLVHTNNSYWGGGDQVSWGDYGAVSYGNLLNPTSISGNVYNENYCAIMFHIGTTVGMVDSNAVFGNVLANTKDIAIKPGVYIDAEMVNPTGITTTDYAFQSILLTGSNLKYTSYNGTANDDRGVLQYGNFQKTGTGLSDTTAHTAGGFAMRFEPNSSTSNLAWSFKVPTGNIQNRTMAVSVWCNINNAAYYASTYQLPRLTINFDNGTTAYAQASQQTGWQLLTVPFTPTTTYGQLTVTIDGRTSATSTNAYFYIDDFSILYPAGYQLNLGAMDLWANALPITPPIATNLSALDVWTAPISTVTGTGTTGAKLNTLRNAKLLIGDTIII